MSHSVPNLSALLCIRQEAPSSQTKELTNWIIEYADVSQSTSQQHPDFNPQTGVYKVPKDGIYLLIVQLIPIGGPTLHNARQTRQGVYYALHLQHPLGDEEYHDIGTHNLGQVEHLRAGTNISCVRMAGAPGSVCLRIYISCIQRKRKRDHEPLSKKQLKRRKRKPSWSTHRHDDDEDDSSDSEWDHGFDSDSSIDDLSNTNEDIHPSLGLTTGDCKFSNGPNARAASVKLLNGSRMFTNTFDDHHQRAIGSFSSLQLGTQAPATMSHPPQQQYWGRQTDTIPAAPQAPPPLLAHHPLRPTHAQPPPQQNPPTLPPKSPQTHTPAPPSLFSSLPPAGEPIRLYTSIAEKETYEDMSAIYSLITATERLENMWARRGAISHDDYERQCGKLIQQYNVLRTGTEAAIPNIDLFIAEYDVKASLARPRLKTGVPGTVFINPGGEGKDQGKFIMRCTTLFHYVGNCIDMNQRAVGLLLPDLISLMKTLNRIPALGNDFEFGERIRWWVEKLNSTPAADELSEQDASQLKLDLDTGFAEFESAYND